MAFELEIITNKNRREVWKRAFRMWQKHPHEVAPIGETERKCATCGTEFKGNFCPRCGQSARIGRFSFKTAFLLFLDIWGMGNRGMYHSIRDLIFRPGYMIRDYINGHQAAYFPPFKMFFILTTFSLILTHGFDLGLETKEPQSSSAEELIIDSNKSIDTDNEKDEKIKKIAKSMFTVSQFIGKFSNKNPAISGCIFLLLLSAPLYLFIRHCPAIPDLRYSEHIVAIVYTSNMYSIFVLIASLLPFTFLSDIIKIIAVIMVFVALHQFTGYSKSRLLLYLILTLLITFVLLTIAIIGFGFMILLFK